MDHTAEPSSATPSPTRTHQRRASHASMISTDSEMDWDRSMSVEPELCKPFPESQDVVEMARPTTPRNSVAFPAGELTPGREPRTRKQSGAPPRGGIMGNTPKRPHRTLSELLRMHAEKGTTCVLSPEEAGRVGYVLGQWINSSLSPYEPDSDEFFVRGKDDLFVPSPSVRMEVEGRQRGMSHSGTTTSSSS